MTVSFETSKEDFALIDRILNRYFKRLEEVVADMRRTGDTEAKLPDRLHVAMDLIATHVNGTPLDLQRLLDAPDFDFFHDIGGIRRHLNRETGKLGDHFLPRTAKMEKLDG